MLGKHLRLLYCEDCEFFLLYIVEFAPNFTDSWGPDLNFQHHLMATGNNLLLPTTSYNYFNYVLLLAD